MKILSKNTQKVIYLKLKEISHPINLSEKEKHFAQALEEITGLTFSQFYALLAESTFKLAEAYGLFGRENYLETAERLGSLNMKLTEFASKAKLPL